MGVEGLSTNKKRYFFLMTEDIKAFSFEYSFSDLSKYSTVNLTVQLGLESQSKFLKD